MKKTLFLFAAIFCSFYARVFSEDGFFQQLIPHRVFVGDTAELRITFDSSIDFFKDEPESDEKTLNIEKLPFQADNDEFSVQNAVLRKNGSSCTVILILTPWKTGNIVLPSFDLMPLLTADTFAPLMISPNPFEVSSVLSGESEELFFPPIAPLLVPGTIYFVWLFIVLFLIFLLFLLILFMRRKKIMDFIKMRILLSFYAKNARRTLKELKRLEEKDKKIGDIEFCSIFQKILRKYLQERLGYGFSSVTTKEFSMAFSNATGGFMSAERAESAEKIEGVFRRTDYIRYAQNSADANKFPSSLYAAVLQEGERKQIIESGKSLVNSFEDYKTSSSAGGGGENA